MKREKNMEETIQTLNELIATCYSGQQGFAEAADYLASAAIKNFCAEQSRMRAQFSADLQEEMQSLGGNWNHMGGRAAVFAWFNSVEKGEDHAIVAACESAEDVAVQQYEKALTHSLPATVRSVIEHQYRSIKQAHDQIRAWNRRDSA